MFLIFSHLCSVTNLRFIFGFAEWGLPIVYGLLLLLEHVWVFGSYMLLYATGVGGRRNYVVTLLEDSVALIIMVARVVLQVIRGVIVGMFHFICREALLNMRKWWDNECVSGSGIEDVAAARPHAIDGIFMLVDVLLAACGLLVIMAIMFLQLVFLVVSV